MAGNKVNSKSKSKEYKNKLKNSADNGQPQEENDIDLSLLRKPIQTSVTGFAQARKIFDWATEELKGLLSTECDILYECKVCRNIFRSLANFISHKRIYCKEKFTIAQHGHFIKSATAVNELRKISRLEQDYLDFIKGQDAEVTDEACQDENDARIGLSKDLTAVIEDLTKVKGVTPRESQDGEPEIVTQKIGTTNVAVFQTRHTDVSCNDTIKLQVDEIEGIFSKNQGNLLENGKFVSVPSTTSEGKADGVIQISDDDEEVVEKAELKCKTCNLQFSTQKTLKFHIKHKHEENRLVYPCPDCLDIFSTSWSVFRHLFKIHRKTSAQIRRMRESIQSKAFRMNNPPAFYEKKRLMKVMAEQKLTDEERIEQENQAWMDNLESDSEVPRCGGCGRTFERKAALTAHTHTCHSRSRALARKLPDTKRIEIQIRKDYNKGPAPAASNMIKSNVDRVFEASSVNKLVVPKDSAADTQDNNSSTIKDDKRVEVIDLDTDALIQSSKPAENEFILCLDEEIKEKNVTKLNIMDPLEIKTEHINQDLQNIEKEIENRVISKPRSDSRKINLEAKIDQILKKNEIIVTQSIKQENIDKKHNSENKTTETKRRIKEPDIETRKDMLNHESLETLKKINENDENEAEENYKTIYPLAREVEAKNLESFKEKISPCVEFFQKRCLICDSQYSNVDELLKHMALHVKWFRYSCKLCHFMHYEFSELTVHMKTVHKLKDKFYLSTVKALSANEALGFAESMPKLAEKMIESRRSSRSVDDDPTIYSRCSSESRLSDGESNLKLGKRRKINNSKSNSPSKDEPTLKKRPNEMTMQKVMQIILGDKDTGNEKEDINQHLMDKPGTMNRKRQRTSDDIIGSARRPIRNRTKPKRADFEYDLSNLLKMEAEAYRDNQERERVTNTKPVPARKKTSSESPSQSSPEMTPTKEKEIIVKEVVKFYKGALRRLSLAAASKYMALFRNEELIKNGSEADNSSTKVSKVPLGQGRVISKANSTVSSKKHGNKTIEPIGISRSKSLLRGEYSQTSLRNSRKTPSPEKRNRLEKEKNISLAGTSHSFTSKNISSKNLITELSKVKSKHEAKTTVPEIKPDKNEVNPSIKIIFPPLSSSQLETDKEQMKEAPKDIDATKTGMKEFVKDLPSIVPLKLSKENMELIKAPLLGQNICVNKDGKKAKILLIKPIKSKDGFTNNTPIQLQAIKIKRPSHETDKISVISSEKKEINTSDCTEQNEGAVENSKTTKSIDFTACDKQLLGKTADENENSQNISQEMTVIRAKNVEEINMSKEASIAEPKFVESMDQDEESTNKYEEPTSRDEQLTDKEVDSIGKEEHPIDTDEKTIDRGEEPTDRCEKTADMDEETADMDEETADMDEETADMDAETADMDEEIADMDEESSDRDEENFEEIEILTCQDDNIDYEDDEYPIEKLSSGEESS